MNVEVIRDFTHVLGAPAGWKPEDNGECGMLAVREEMNGQIPCMTSAWSPTSDELAALNAGGRVYLRVLGQVHPPVAIYALGPDT